MNCQNLSRSLFRSLWYQKRKRSVERYLKCSICGSWYNTSANRDGTHLTRISESSSFLNCGKKQLKANNFISDRKLTRPSMICTWSWVRCGLSLMIGTDCVFGIARPRSIIAGWMCSPRRWGGRSWRKPSTPHMVWKLTTRWKRNAYN